jgi:SPP1 family holin
MKISKGTIVRTAMLFVVVLNIILKQFNIDVLNVSESEILSLIEAVIEVAVIAVGFWKNNSYTQKAIEADEFLRKLRESE